MSFDDLRQDIEEGPRKILIVDDEQFNINAIKILLKVFCKINDPDQICDFA